VNHSTKIIELKKNSRLWTTELDLFLLQIRLSTGSGILFSHHTHIDLILNVNNELCIYMCIQCDHDIRYHWISQLGNLVLKWGFREVIRSILKYIIFSDQFQIFSSLATRIRKTTYFFLNDNSQFFSTDSGRVLFLKTSCEKFFAILKTDQVRVSKKLVKCIIRV